MKRSKAICSFISLVVCIILGIWVQNVIKYDIGPFIIVILSTFALLTVTLISLYNIIQKEKIFFNIAWLCMGIFGIWLFWSLQIGLTHIVGNIVAVWVNFCISLFGFLISLFFVIDLENKKS